MGLDKTIAILEGDGIGPEVMDEAVKVLRSVGQKYGHRFSLERANFGAESYLKGLGAFPEYTKNLVQQVDATLKGPIGLDKIGTDLLQAKGVKLENETVIALRGVLDTYAGYRPVILPKAFADFSPLKQEVIGEGVDILMMRELVGGIYFGPKREAAKGIEITGDSAFDDCTYSVEQIERFAHVCFKEAQNKNHVLTNVHKKNVLATSRLWNAVFNKVSAHYTNVKMNEVLVDALAFDLMVKPTKYNGVMALENMMGDIITDQAGGVLGSLGLMPSACFNPETRKGYFEPSHGSAPDIAGQHVANPYSMIGSAAFMLEKSFGLKEEANDVWTSLTKVFADGFRTRELAKANTPLDKILLTPHFTNKVIENILNGGKN